MSMIQNKLSELKKKPFFTSADARNAGVHPAHLTYYAKQGVLEKVSRGVYRDPETDLEVDVLWENLALTAASISNGIICGKSALIYYNLIDDFEHQHCIAIPNAQQVKVPKGVKIYRHRDLSFGINTIQMGKLSVKIFDRERAIVWAFQALSLELAVKALRRYLEWDERQPNLKKLQKYAANMRVNIEPYVFTLVNQ